MPEVNVETLADGFLRDHLKKYPGLELIPVECHVEKRQHSFATRDEVHSYIKTLETQEDLVVRHDISDNDAPDELLHAEPVPEEIDIDLDAEPVILARKRGHVLSYFAGIHDRTKRLLWTNDARLAHRFQDDSELVNTVFGFQDDHDLVLKESFENLQLMVLAPPPTPSF